MRQKFFAIFILTILVFLVGCSKSGTVHYEVEEENNNFIDLKFIEQSSNDIIVEYKNKLSKDISTSSDNNFRISKIDNNTPHEINNNLGYEDILLIIKPNESLRQKLELSKLDTDLEKGTYEITKEFYTEDSTLELKFKLNIK